MGGGEKNEGGKGVLLYPIEFYMSRFFTNISRGVNEPLPPFVGDFTSPQSGLVKVAETVNHNRDRQGDSEDSKNCGNSSDKFSETRERSGSAYTENNNKN